MPLNPAAQKANDQFVLEVIKGYKTKELAIEGTLKWAWDLYKKGDYVMSMRRFNEVWLLDKNNSEAFHGYSLILRAWGYAGEADKWEQKAKDAGYQAQPK
ncbi:MAG: hypothetical protein NTY34_03055 [Candidatus Omnitrophica bacterium]|nr:hypothetical protein [Candidatus Omnitrophota bacterium]